MTDLSANKDLVRAFIAAWNDRDFNRFGALMADTALLHVGGATVPCDPAGTRAIAEEWTTAFPDWRFELLSLVAEGNRIVAHMPYSGTFTKPILGVAPTGRFARVDEMVIFRVAGGKVAEAWEVYDECGMWRQLGAPPPG
jgi:predicted ester cyclase